VGTEVYCIYFENTCFTLFAFFNISNKLVIAV
jgi:hypothetical protein